MISYYFHVFFLPLSSPSLYSSLFFLLLSSVSTLIYLLHYFTLLHPFSLCVFVIPLSLPISLSNLFSFSFLFSPLTSMSVFLSLSSLFLHLLLSSLYTLLLFYISISLHFLCILISSTLSSIRHQSTNQAIYLSI